MMMGLMWAYQTPLDVVTARMAYKITILRKLKSLASLPLAFFADHGKRVVEREEHHYDSGNCAARPP